MAALMVALAHYVLAFQPAMLFGTLNGTEVSFAAAPGIAATPLTVLFQPELAVAIFFVLSGFVLAASVGTRPAALAELALRRWLRLSIPILAVSIGVWVMLRTGWHADRTLAPLNHSQWLDMNFGWLAWEPNDFGNMVFQALVDVYARGRHWWNTALWTMPVELWGSLGLFAAYAALRRLQAAQRWRLATALLAFAALWSTHYAGFAAGAALYELSLATSVARLHRLAWVGGAVVFGLGVLLGGANYVGYGLAPYGEIERLLQRVSSNPIMTLHRIAAVLLVAGALLWPPARWVLASRPCRFLGRISFMLYLCHIALLCSVASWTILRLLPLAGYNLATLLALPVFLAVLLGVAALGARFIDAPGTRFAHRWARAAMLRTRGWRRPALAR